jgi:DNA polymerase I
MLFEGFFIDADYVTENNKAVIRLWCKDASGKNVIVLDPNFEPYFYVVPRYGLDVTSVQNVSADRRGEEIKPKRLEPVDRKKFGKDIKAYKVFAEHPQHVVPLREAMGRHADVYEADILFSIRYITDKGLVPMDGIRVSGKETSVGYAQTAILAESVEHVPREDYPVLSIMAFDSEMAVEHGMPNADRDPIIILSAATPEGVKIFEMKESDGNVVEEFVAFVQECNPDVIVGYNSDAFDWPYLIGRAAKHRIPLAMGADGSEPRMRTGGIPSIELTGRQIVDLYRIAKRDLGEVKVKTLDNVADYLGVMKKDERVDLSPREIYECWNDKNHRDVLYEYSEADAKSTLMLAEKLLPMQYEFTRMVRYPLEEVAKMGRGRNVESFLSAEAYKIGELIPQKGGSGETYEGGYVMEPKKGIHESVICLDFSAMYPSIMVSFNISPDTVAPSGAGAEDVYVAPEVGHRFLKQPDGFFKKILMELMGRRGAIKKEMAKHEKGTKEYQLLDIRQQSIKILTNSFYGYTGWRTARWYRKECAEATTAWGRHFVKEAMKHAEKMGFEVIYGDTDSLFVKASGAKEKLLKMAEKLSKEISAELPLDLEVENFYKVIFFTEKKKRYAGLTADNEIVVKGLEVRRGDWCKLAKEIQSEIIRLILEERDEKKAVSLVKETIDKIKSGAIPIEKFVIYKTLTKKPSDYEAKQAHVVAATREGEHEMEYEIGSKIPYVIVKGSQKVSDRAYLLEVFLEDKLALDTEYYVTHQIIPAASRILKYFGYEDNELLGRKQMQQKSLEHFAK